MNTAIAFKPESTSPVSVDLLASLAKSENRPAEWSSDDAVRANQRYEKFLILAAEFKSQPHAPTRDIDVMWHLHMQHPKAYYEDCLKLFGEIFDHDGGFGKGDGELPRLQRTFANTARLWERKYGEPYVAEGREANELTNCWHDCQGRCWHACSSK